MNKSMILLLFSASVMFAQQDKELITCRFLDEFYDWSFTYSNQQENDPTNTPSLDTVAPITDEDILYIRGPKLEYSPDDVTE